MDDTGFPPWRVFWQRGMELLRLDNYVDALVQFNKAASRKSGEQLIFESRGIALEMLGRYEEALRDSQRVVDLAPASPEGYALSSQILFKTGKLHASLQMATHALKRVNDCDQEQRDKLLCLKKHILNSLSKTNVRITPASHFGKLPFDIASVIFILAAGDQASGAITISHVCKGWRAMALKIPALWKSVVISRGPDVRKAGVFLKRANANIKRLEIHSDVGIFLTIFFERHAQDSFWDQLETLALVNVAYGRAYHVIPWERLRLKTFILTSKPRLSRHGIWEAVDRMAYHTISSVTFAAPLIPSPHFERYRDLTRLKIGSSDFVVQCPQRVLTSLFYNNPALNSVILDVLVTELTDLQWPTNKAPFAMTCLVHLENHRYGGWLSNLLKGAFSFPALRTLRFYELILGVYLCLLEPFAANLVALRLSNTGWYTHTATITSLLQAAHNLVTLDLLGFQTNLTDEMDAMAGRSQSVICPKLEHLHFGSCRMLSSRSLVSLVESRLFRANEDKSVAVHLSLAIASAVEHRQSTYDGMGGGATVTPIQSLVIKDCALIDPDTIQQLRTTVKRIRYTPSSAFTAKTYQAPKRTAWR